MELEARAPSAMVVWRSASSQATPNYCYGGIEVLSASS